MRASVLALVLCGCGGASIHDAVDAAGGDDAPPVPSGISLVASRAGRPSAGARVYVQRADDSVLGMLSTDGMGEAAFETAETELVVTVVIQAPAAVLASYELYTFAGVQPGDRLHLEILPPAPDPGDAVIFPLVIPTDPDPRVTDYAVYSSCGSITQNGNPLFVPAGPPGQMLDAQFRGCRGSADFLVVANENVTTPIDSFYVTNVPVADGTMLSLTGTYAPVAGMTASYTHLPASVTGVTTTVMLASPRGALTSVTASAGATGGGEVLALPIAAATNAVATIVSYAYPAPGEVSAQTLVDRGPQADLAVDWTPRGLRRYASIPALDRAHHALAWSEDPTGVRADFAIGKLQITRDNANDIDRWAWQIVAPRTDEPILRLPVLPTEILDFTPAAMDAVSVLDVVNVALPYAVARTLALSQTTASLGDHLTFQNIFVPDGFAPRVLR